VAKGPAEAEIRFFDSDLKNQLKAGKILDRSANFPPPANYGKTKIRLEMLSHENPSKIKVELLGNHPRVLRKGDRFAVLEGKNILASGIVRKEPENK